MQHFTPIEDVKQVSSLYLRILCRKSNEIALCCGRDLCLEQITIMNNDKKFCQRLVSIVSIF